MERLHGGPKDLAKRYMAEQVRRAATPAARALGIDQIAIHKGHDYRVGVSDLERGRPIRFGDSGRTEVDIDRFFADPGPEKGARIERAVMDMGRPLRTWVGKNAAKAAIVFDKFRILRHLSDPLDPVRRQEYKCPQGKDRASIKGQRYTLLSHRQHLTLDGRQALKKPLPASRRLNTAYLLNESFGQLWSYRTERGARAFFERCKQSLRWQRLAPYQKSVKMIQRHWDGIAAYCHPDHKVSLGRVEGLNNEIRVIQRSAYGDRDQDYFRLKIIASFLPPLSENARLHPH